MSSLKLLILVTAVAGCTSPVAANGSGGSADSLCDDSTESADSKITPRALAAFDQTSIVDLLVVMRQDLTVESVDADSSNTQRMQAWQDIQDAALASQRCARAAALNAGVPFVGAAATSPNLFEIKATRAQAYALAGRLDVYYVDMVSPVESL